MPTANLVLDPPYPHSMSAGIGSWQRSFEIPRPPPICCFWCATHPLLGVEDVEFLPDAELLSAWEAGETASGVYDDQDWYFQPLNADARVKRTGPNIEIAQLPVRIPHPVPTGKEFFQLAYWLYNASLASDEMRWKEALVAYQTVLRSRFNLTEVFSVRDLYTLYLGLAVAYDQLGDRARAEWARKQALPYKPAN